MIVVEQKLKAISSSKPMTHRCLILLLSLNALNSTILYGCLPSLSTYSILPYGQAAYHYSRVLEPMAYPLALILSIYQKMLPTILSITGSFTGLLLFSFIARIAWQSPCPWGADTTHGAWIMVLTWFIVTLLLAYMRITIGNRLKMQYLDEKGMFLFGASVQFGSIMGAIPCYILVNILGVFIARESCQEYCVA